MFYTSNTKFSTVCLSEENQEFQGCHILNTQRKESVQPSKIKVMTSSSFSFKLQFSSAIANNWTI